MDAQKVHEFKHRMNTLAYGEAMLAAARDYGEELLEEERKAKQAPKHAALDMDELADDPELEALHEQRVSQLKAEREKRAQMSFKGHGELTDITEADFLDTVTKAKRVVCHFFHRDFERCKIMDKHLKLLANAFFETRFCRISAPDAPFFVAKLKVQMLPCVICFVDGVAIDRVTGFDELGGKDDFATPVLEAKLCACGVLQRREQDGEETNEPEQRRHAIRKGGVCGHRALGPDDEDSDFDD